MFTNEQLAPHIEAWLNVIALLPVKEWRVVPMFLPHGEPRALRDVEDYCPLCYLAKVIGTIRVHKGSWNLALREAFGELGTIETSAACRIASAADNPAHWLRPLLLKALSGQQLSPGEVLAALKNS